jgi:hypothetical protein
MASYATMPYAAPPPSYATPSYYTTPSYGDEYAPIPLTPLVIPGDPPSAGGGGGGGLVTKFFALPLLFVLPILLPIIAVVVVLGGGGGGGAGGRRPLPLTASNDTDIYETTPYYDDSAYGNDYQDENEYNHSNQDSQYRKRRQVEKNKNIPTAVPSMSIAQVERLTQVVYAAINSQECIQRLLCEVGSLSRSFSKTIQTVTKAVEDYVPEKLKDSYYVLTKVQKCEQFQCGSLKVKK